MARIAGTLVGAVKAIATGKEYKIAKKAVGDWRCSCSSTCYPCPHMKAVWAGKRGKVGKKYVVKLYRPRLLKRGEM